MDRRSFLRGFLALPLAIPAIQLLAPHTPRISGHLAAWMPWKGTVATTGAWDVWLDSGTYKVSVIQQSGVLTQGTFRAPVAGIYQAPIPPEAASFAYVRTGFVGDWRNYYRHPEWEANRARFFRS